MTPGSTPDQHGHGEGRGPALMYVGDRVVGPALIALESRTINSKIPHQELQASADAATWAVDRNGAEAGGRWSVPRVLRRSQAKAVMSRSKRVDRREIAGEFERVRAEFHRLVGGASSECFDRPSAGTRWTNEQLLFHMVFGYMVVRRLLILVRILGRLPNGVSCRFAAAQNASTRLFDEVNYRGTCQAAGYSTVTAWCGNATRSSIHFCGVWWKRPRTTCSAACTSPTGGIRSSRTT